MPLNRKSVRGLEKRDNERFSEDFRRLPATLELQQRGERFAADPQRPEIGILPARSRGGQRFAPPADLRMFSTDL